MARRAEEPEAPTVFGARMRLASSHRHRRVFRRGKLTVYNWHTRTDWMGAHESGVFVSAGDGSTPQAAARLLEREVRSVHRRLGRLLGER